MIVIDGTKMLSMVFLEFSNEYISNISNIYNPNVNLSLASQIKRDKIFPDTKLDNIFSHFSVMYLVYILFLLVCGNYPITLKSGRCINLL